MYTVKKAGKYTCSYLKILHSYLKKNVTNFLLEALPFNREAATHYRINFLIVIQVGNDGSDFTG